MAQIVCLANSYKPGGRCIAGMDINTKQWIRPVPNNMNRALTRQRMINGEEPNILDVLEIPMEDHGPDEEYQPENRLLKKGEWQKIGRLQPQDLLDYCEDDRVVLHNDQDYVLPDLLLSKPINERKSLQLIHSSNVKFNRDLYDNRKWRAFFQYGRKKYLDLKLTDVVLSDRLRKNEKISNECILTISLATPWKRDEKTPERCYKMVAGVVEL